MCTHLNTSPLACMPLKYNGLVFIVYACLCLFSNTISKLLVPLTFQETEDNRILPIKTSEFKMAAQACFFEELASPILRHTNLPNHLSSSFQPIQNRPRKSRTKAGHQIRTLRCKAYTKLQEIRISATLSFF